MVGSEWVNQISVTFEHRERDQQFCAEVLSIGNTLVMLSLSLLLEVALLFRGDASMDKFSELILNNLNSDLLLWLLNLLLFNIHLGCLCHG